MQVEIDFAGLHSSASLGQEGGDEAQAGRGVGKD